MVGVYLILFTHNNYEFSELKETDIETAYDKAVVWLDANRSLIYEEHNPILWWMLIESLNHYKNNKLYSIIQEYKQNNHARYLHTPWRYFIHGEIPTVDDVDVLVSDYPDYNKHFIYAFTCDKDLQDADIIQKQNRLNFCFQNHPVSPACFTHQMMAFRFMQRTECSGDFDVAQAIDKLADYIQYQLYLDPRLVDVYIQRVLMLLESGHKEKVRQRWIYRIVHGANEDGGWGDFQSIIPLFNQQALGFSSRLISVDRKQSTFHATAQGVLLMALLMEHQD